MLDKEYFIKVTPIICAYIEITPSVSFCLGTTSSSPGCMDCQGPVVC